jgi:zinc protease
VAERHTVPQVIFNLVIDAGYAADQFAAAGTASVALDMLDEGTTSRNAIQISDELASLGATLFSGSALDSSSVSMSALTSKLDPSLALYADVILNPSFPAAELERMRPRRLAQIKREGTIPNAAGLRVLPKLMYGEKHAYGLPLTGSGYESTIGKMSREDLVKFHQAWFKPNNATLVVVGDTTLAEIQPKLERLFAAWKPGEAPKKNIGSVTVGRQPRVYILDQPGSVQSMIFAGHVAPPKSDPNDLAIEAMNTVLGGTFTSRVNMNLRENKHWSYGAGSAVVDARGQRPFFVAAPVQADKTKESMQEILKELNGIANSMPLTPEEVDRAKRAQTLTLPGRWESAQAVSDSLTEMVVFGYADDYFKTYAGRVNALSVDQVRSTATAVVQPQGLIWVVVGDRARIEPAIRELNLGPIGIVDADGKVITPP